MSLCKLKDCEPGNLYKIYIHYDAYQVSLYGDVEDVCIRNTTKKINKSTDLKNKSIIFVSDVFSHTITLGLNNYKYNIMQVVYEGKIFYTGCTSLSSMDGQISFEKLT